MGGSGFQIMKLGTDLEGAAEGVGLCLSSLLHVGAPLKMPFGTEGAAAKRERKREKNF